METMAEPKDDAAAMARKPYGGFVLPVTTGVEGQRELLNVPMKLKLQFIKAIWSTFILIPLARYQNIQSSSWVKSFVCLPIKRPLNPVGLEAGTGAPVTSPHPLFVNADGQYVNPIFFK